MRYKDITGFEISVDEICFMMDIVKSFYNLLDLAALSLCEDVVLEFLRGHCFITLLEVSFQRILADLHLNVK